jgi:hypothetical protein
LKEQIKTLKMETQNLKDIISAICASSDRDVLIDQVVATLPRQNFEFVAEVAEVCRRNIQNAPEQDGFPPAVLPRRGGSAIAGPSFSQQGGLYDESFSSRRYTDGIQPGGGANVGWTDGVDDADEEDDEMDGDEESYVDGRPRYPPNPGWGYSDP